MAVNNDRRVRRKRKKSASNLHVVPSNFSAVKGCTYGYKLSTNADGPTR